MKRKIIKIDENLCNGCGICMPNCPEGALQMIDGKARLVSDLFCDGLGACIGHCPQGAIAIEEREAEDYDERKVMGNIIKQGENTIKAHLKHLKEHNQTEYFNQAIEFLKVNNIKNPLDLEKQKEDSGKFCPFSGCPGSRIIDFNEKKDKSTSKAVKSNPELRQWPVQLMLVPPTAPYLKDSDLLITADCVPFAYPGFHQDFLKVRVLLVGCPKLDDTDYYKEKLVHIFKLNNIKTITCVHMEVPCCFGLEHIIKSALKEAGTNTTYKDITIGIKGDILTQ